MSILDNGLNLIVLKCFYLAVPHFYYVLLITTSYITVNVPTLLLNCFLLNSNSVLSGPDKHFLARF